MAVDHVPLQYAQCGMGIIPVRDVQGCRQPAAIAIVQTVHISLVINLVIVKSVANSRKKKTCKKRKLSLCCLTAPSVTHE